MKEEQVSGNIWAVKSCYGREGEQYLVRAPHVRGNKMRYEWELVTDNIAPKDLRALADRIEEKRSK